MQLKQSTDGTSHESSWIRQLYQRGPRTVEMELHRGVSYLVTLESEFALEQWFAAESKGGWFNDYSLAIIDIARF
jgi:hypothetical protein